MNAYKIDRGYIQKRTKINRDGCWVWQGALQTHGYSFITIPRDSRPRFGTQLGHRIAYILYKGVPTSETLDHLCENKACLNPEHLEEVTQLENNRRRDASFKKRNPFFPCGHRRSKTGRYRRSGYQQDTGKPKNTFYCHPCLLELNARRKNAAANSLHTQ